MEKSTSPASNEIWSLVRETQKNLKELSVSQKETDKQIQAMFAGQKETDRRLKARSVEIDKQIQAMFAGQKETDRRLKAMSAETNERMQKIGAWVQSVGSRFNQRWGALVESLVEGNIVRLFRDRGVDITQIATRLQVQRTGPDNKIQKREFDMIAANGTDVVALEVKTTLAPRDVKKFLENLKDFKYYFPQYKSLRVYGAMAYLKNVNKAAAMAEEEGLFIIRATGDSASIVNRKDFKPRVFP